MAERYQDRPFPADDEYDRGGQYAASKAEADPLAELARLIGQTDPFTHGGRGNAALAPRGNDQFRLPQQAVAGDDDVELGPPPSWIQHRAAPEIAPPQDPFAARHPLRPAPPIPAPDPVFQQNDYEAPQYEDASAPLPADNGRYDDALYGQIAPAHGTANALQDEVYPPQPYYGEQDGYGDEPSSPLRSRRAGMMTVAAVLALAVVGTGGAFAYRTYIGAPRSSEIPVIRAETGPTKVMSPNASDGAGKPIQDRLAAGNGVEALISREEQPVDPSKASPRLPPLPATQNPGSPFPAVAAPPAKPAPNNGTLAGDEPRKIRTLSVRPDQADLAANPAAKPAPRVAAPAPAATRSPPAPIANANASTANAPLSLVPPANDAAARPTRLAAAPAAPQATGSAGGNYVVQVSSQRSESDAQASYRSLQGKFPSVLGSRAPLIKRADLGDKGVYYRAMVGPFGSPDEATRFCGNLKSAGGQCVVQRN